MIKVARGCCGQEELDEVKEAFDYGYFGLAYKTNEFETEIQKYLHTDRHVITTNTGTNALHLAFDTIGLKPGDEVIMPSFTFVATAQAVAMCGATPIFCEVYPDTFLIDIEDVKSKITSKTKAIVPVHYAGRPCDMDKLLSIKNETGIRIIEDAAHAFGSLYNGRKIGSIGDITCFSFDSIKVMTCGEGGAIVTDDVAFDNLSRKKRLLGIDRKAMHVKDWKQRSWIYDVPTLGYRYHMSNINAAIGLAQITKLDSFIEKRRRLCYIYDNELQSLYNIGCVPEGYEHIAPFMYAVRIKNNKRNELKDYLMQHDIESGISYIPCHHFSLFEKQTINLPITDTIFNEILCLPLHFDLTEADIYKVTATIKEFFNK